MKPLRNALFAANLLTLFLIAIGGFVRAAGAGLGCPDWPRCFGLWIPPISVADLPAAYDPSQFNALKTWIEYINRLIGVVVGFSILWAAFQSFRFRKQAPSIWPTMLITVIVLLFQGWLGGRVVHSSLEGWLITAHMFFAFLILGLLVYSYLQTLPQDHPQFKPLENRVVAVRWLAVLIPVFLIQVIVGTQVREAIDHVADAGQLERFQWVGASGILAVLHRSFSWLPLLLAGGTVYAMRADLGRSLLSARLGLLVLIALILQAGTGIGLFYYALPPGFQVIHLVLSAVTATALFILWFSIYKQKSPA